MYKPFFPDLLFGWAFVALLGVFLSVASYTDWRRTIIPKSLTLSLLAVGLVVSLVRVAWLSSAGRELWLLETGAVWRGLLDGLFFALAGFSLSFAMIFLLWLMGTCGGGDVKLFAALGTWLGPVYSIFVLIVAQAVLLVLMIAKVFTVGFSPRAVRKMVEANRPEAGKRKKNEEQGGQPKTSRIRLTYSFPVAVATLAVLLWVFRFELQLTERPPSQTPRAQIYAR